MRHLLSLFAIVVLASCNSNVSNNHQHPMMQRDIKNEKLKSYSFLKCMYDDAYFPKFLVDQGKSILVELCLEIEATHPKNLDELYKLTHASTEKFNDLEDEFLKNDSEIETAARECIAENFEFIAASYEYHADTEELIAPRNW